MMEIYVTDEAGANVIHSKNEFTEKREKNGGLKEGHVAALLTSFALFEEEQGIITRKTESGGLTILFGIRNRRSQLQPFVIKEASMASHKDENTLHIIEALIDMLVTPVVLGTNRKLQFSRQNSKIKELHAVISHYIKTHCDLSTQRIQIHHKLLDMYSRHLHEISYKLGTKFAWIQNGHVTVTHNKMTMQNNSTLRALEAIVASAPQKYNLFQLYLSEISSGKAYALHVYRSDGGLKLALISDSLEPISNNASISTLISNCLHTIDSF